ncbi:MAG: TraR/DksA C4-type zinc finger protein [Patescibacteria group bacterium]
MIKKLFIKKLKEGLEKEKDRVEASLQGFAKKDRKLKGDWDVPFPKLSHSNLEDEAEEVEEYEALLPIEYSLENRLKDINSALEKIKKGRYGKCENCQNPIQIERLKAAPEARFCLKCKH